MGVRVVVDQADHPQLLSLVMRQLAEQLLARLAGADDERALPLRRPHLHEAACLAADADREAEPPHEKDREQPVEHEHGARHAAGVAGEPQDREERRRAERHREGHVDRKSTRLNSSHSQISYAVFCLKKKTEYIAPVAPHFANQLLDTASLPCCNSYTQPTGTVLPVHSSRTLPDAITASLTASTNSMT